MACCLGGVARAQLRVLPGSETQSVFAGNARTIAVVFQNPSLHIVEAPLRTQIYQASSATTVSIGTPADWKELRILPGQTVLESAALDFPRVKAGTKFLIQWIDGGNRVIGATDVLVYPTNLLTELRLVASGEALGVFDPTDELKPLLKRANVDFVDLADRSTNDFLGALAIVGPFSAKTQTPRLSVNWIKALAGKGAGVVRIQPIPAAPGGLAPSFYPVTNGAHAVIIVQPELLRDLPDNPQAQLNLIYLSRLAVQPKLLAPIDSIAQQ